MITKIISGGQTGADQAGLEAGRMLGIQTGGWAPKGWTTEDGPRPRLLGNYGLRECEVSGYPVRTVRNIRDSDGTVIFGNTKSKGSALTLKLVHANGRPHHVVWFAGDPVFENALRRSGRQCAFRIWLDYYSIKTLNVAGNRESSNPGIYRFTLKFLLRTLKD